MPIEQLKLNMLVKMYVVVKPPFWFAIIDFWFISSFNERTNVFEVEIEKDSCV